MKKSEANIEDLRNQTVSWGTHRPDDLIPKFLAVLKEYGKEAYDKYVSENPEVEDWKMLDDETKGWVVDELFDLLDGIAPEDCYFGAHPGDGADFGFWQVDESKKNEATLDDYRKRAKELGGKLRIRSNSLGKFGEIMLGDTGYSTMGSVFTKELLDKYKPLFDLHREMANDPDIKAMGIIIGESKKSEAKYDRPVTLYITTRYDNAEKAKDYLDGISGGQVKVSQERNGDSLSVSIVGSDEDIDAFLEVYKDNYDNLETDCDADVMGWTAPCDLVYYTAQGRKELKGESKKNEKGNKDIYTLGLTRIDADGDEEGLDDMQAAQSFYDEDKAIQAAKELADSYSDYDDVVLVSVFAGEQEKPNGDIVGEPFDIFTASSSDSATTAKYREKASYVQTDGLDYYAKGDKSEAKKKYYGYGKDDAIDKEDNDFMWQVAYEWFEDRLPEKLKSEADSAVDKVIDKDSRAYEEIVTMDDYHDYLQKYGPSVIKDIKADNESKQSEAKQNEGWTGGFGSRQEILDLMDGGILNKDWNLEKRFGNWGCYVNQNTGRPIVLQMLIESDNDHGWAYKPVFSDMGPYDINIQAAKWLKPRLEKWVEENPDKSKDVPDHEWEWIEKCLGKAATTKAKKDIAASLVKGDKIKLIDTVDNGAVVTFIEMMAPGKMRILHNGREMSCKTSYIDRKVDATAESKNSESLTDDEEFEWYRFWFDEVKKRVVPGKSGFVDHNCKMLPRSDVRQMWGVAAQAKELCDNFRRYLTYRGYTNSKGSPFAEISWRAEDAEALLAAMNKADGKPVETCSTGAPKKSESLTLKQKELKNMARYGEATDITTISDAEAKELKKKGIETVGVSRGVFGMNGALLRDNEGNKYVITARSSNLFYFI